MVGAPLRGSAATSRVALGTVQLGLEYGVSNTLGRPGDDEAASILQLAAASGVGYADTAPTYGDAEQIIGTHCPPHTLRVITKCVPVRAPRLSAEDVADVRRAVYASLERLRRSSVHGLLVHSSEDLGKPGADRLVDELLTLKQIGVADKIGVSVYAPADLERALEHLQPDLVQLPLNVLDQRFVATGLLEQLTASGVEVHARSAFLQGLLLMDTAHLPTYFAEVSNHLAAALERLGSSPAQRLRACLAYVLSHPVAAVVVGVATSAQLVEVLDALPGPDATSADWADLALHDERFVDPSRWRLVSESAP